jgi:hypothetical protein
METHEIIMDNDIVILKKIPQIEEFLNSDKVLILEEPIKFYGRFTDQFPSEAPFLNSGFMGLPPGYDFGGEIRKTWEKYGKLGTISQADEQGLLMLTLNQNPSIRIKPTDIIEILSRDFGTKITGQESAIHFTQGNRVLKHRAWIEYNDLKKKMTI